MACQMPHTGSWDNPTGEYLPLHTHLFRSVVLNSEHRLAWAGRRGLQVGLRPAWEDVVDGGTFCKDSLGGTGIQGQELRGQNCGWVALGENLSFLWPRVALHQVRTGTCPMHTCNRRYPTQQHLLPAPWESGALLPCMCPCSFSTHCSFGQAAPVPIPVTLFQASASCEFCCCPHPECLTCKHVSWLTNGTFKSGT